jgi:hypothetical protein
MVQIKIFSEKLPKGFAWATLDSNVRLSFVIDNFAALSDIKPGEYTLPINFPRHTFNDTIFDNYHHEAKDKREYTYKSHVFFKGSLVYSGTLFIMESTDESFEGYLTLRVGALTSFSMKLKDVDYGSPFTLSGTYDDKNDQISSYSNDFYPTIPFCFPMIHHPDFFLGTANSRYLSYVNGWDPGTGKYYKNFVDGTDPVANINAIVPMLFLQFIVEKALAMDNLTLAGTFFDDPDLAKLWVYNNKEINGTEPKNDVHIELRSGTLAIPTPWALIHDNEISDPDNAHNTGTGVFTVLYEGHYQFVGMVDVNITNPNLDTNYLYLSIKKNGVVDKLITVLSGQLTTGNYVKAVWINTYYPVADIGKSITFEFTWTRFGTKVATFDINSTDINIVNSSYYLLNQLPNNIYLEQHVPDVTFGELMEAHRDTFNLSLSYDLLGHKIIIDSVDGIFDKTPIDITEKTDGTHYIQQDKIKYKHFNFEFDEGDLLSEIKKDQKFSDPNYVGAVNSFLGLDIFLAADEAGGWDGKIAYVKNSNRFYLSSDGGGFPIWSFLSYGFPDYVVDENGDEEIIPKLSPMMMESIIEPFRATLGMLVPYIKQPGTSDHPQWNIETEYGIRIMFFHGDQNGDDGLTTYPMASSGNRDFAGVQVSTYTLHWAGGDGLFKKFWLRWVNAFQNGDLFGMELNYNLLDIMGFDINNVFRYRTRTYIMKSTKYEMSKFISPMEVEMIQIPVT